MPGRLTDSVQYVKGVGPKRVRILNRLGIETIEDLLHYFPRTHSDRSHPKPIVRLLDGEYATIKGVIKARSIIRPRKGLDIIKVAIDDGTEIAYADWYNQSYLMEYLKEGTKIAISGTIEKKYKKTEIKNFAYEIIEEGKELLNTLRIVPVYNLTEGINQKYSRTIVKRVLDEYAASLPEFLPPDIRKRNKLIKISRAINSIHFPQSSASYKDARRRLVFEEFFLLQLGIALRKRKIEEVGKGIRYRKPGELIGRFSQLLPFELTSAQRRVISEIISDMQQDKPMNRLLQGDVGSGKTVVAVYALLKAIEDGYQGAIMAPTEILAQQHYLTLQELLIPLKIRIELLIGSMGEKEKEGIRKTVEEGKVDIIIGTHTLVQEAAAFAKLGLIIIDEQHKFGVLQRATLRKKGLNPDVLVMTATPIPRTLALTVYGDLNISVLDEMPPGRKGTTTYWVPQSQRKNIYLFIENEIKKGRQAYIVYPLVSESEKATSSVPHRRGGMEELKAATEMQKHLQKEVFPKLKVGLIHGQMPGDEKEKIMTDFKNKKLDILVSTTVIEVGIDISNASIMLIEDAQRFGLAQLHQLRGRIGRGEYQSYCLMFAVPRTFESKKRIKVMTETGDGFQIAEEDLELRGPGEYFGTKQHGMPELKIANLLRDQRLLETARQEAFAFIKKDPKLENPEHRLIRKSLLLKFKGGLEIS
ncbi:ATP-dependent DNA helicase RecG [bacterium]|nr:ATP-dependent DNA helicase RecG [bacterium]